MPGQTVLDFGQVSSGQTATQTVTLTNTGATPLTIRRLTSQWPFLITSTLCGATLPPTVSCTATLTYTPSTRPPPPAPPHQTPAPSSSKATPSPAPTSSPSPARPPPSP
ncbi:choice-of-anchor D domain-containing protein [Tunturiibacter empetritectus]|uniref:choice-of-anchor D domain-containing protein n=1 Tax=Tunturiibacter empetritectus TaxID=3069691 RepID=UPI003D9BDE5A